MNLKEAVTIELLRMIEGTRNLALGYLKGTRYVLESSE